MRNGATVMQLTGCELRNTVRIIREYRRREIDGSERTKNDDRKDLQNCFALFQLIYQKRTSGDKTLIWTALQISVHCCNVM